MSPVTFPVYRSRDGKLFENAKQALRQNILSLAAEKSTCSVQSEFSQVLGFLEQNADLQTAFLEFLSHLDPAAYPIREGQTVILMENDAFGTTSVVVVKKIHKGGNVIVQEGDMTRETHLRNLRPITTPSNLT